MKRHHYPKIPCGCVRANRDFLPGTQTVYSDCKYILYLYAQPSMIALRGQQRAISYWDGSKVCKNKINN